LALVIRWVVRGAKLVQLGGLRWAVRTEMMPMTFLYSDFQARPIVG
jgi:hypothetical protein